MVLDLPYWAERGWLRGRADWPVTEIREADPSLQGGQEVGELVQDASGRERLRTGDQERIGPGRIRAPLGGGESSLGKGGLGGEIKNRGLTRRKTAYGRALPEDRRIFPAGRDQDTPQIVLGHPGAIFRDPRRGVRYGDGRLG